MTIQSVAQSALDSGWFIDQTITRWRGQLPHHLIKDLKRHPAWSSLLGVPDGSRRVLRRIERQLNRRLREYTYDTYWGHYLPAKAAPSWEQGYQSLKQEFELERDRLVSRYDGLRERAQSIGRIVGTQEWKQLHPESLPTEPFLQEWGERIWKTIPSKTELYNNFVCKAIEYRLRKEFSAEEARRFVEELANEYYQRLTGLCVGIREEHKQYTVLSRDRQPVFQQQCKRLIELWVFPQQPILEQLIALQAALKVGDIMDIAGKAGKLMEDCVPRFTQWGWEWILKESGHE